MGDGYYTSDPTWEERCRKAEAEVERLRHELDQRTDPELAATGRRRMSDDCPKCGASRGLTCKGANGGTKSLCLLGGDL